MRAYDLDDELNHHFEQLRQDLIDEGHSPAEATDMARRKLGNRTLVRETVREMGPVRFLDTAVRTVRFAFRTYTRRGGAYLLAMAVLATGIGITAAIFSLVEAVLLRPLPFPDQNSLVVIWKADPKAGAPFVELAYPELLDLQQNVRAFDSVAVMPTTLYGYGVVIQNAGRDPVQVESAPVSQDFFRTLGVSPILGRDFSSADEHVGAAPVAILSNAVWRQEFGSDKTIAGRQIRLNGTGFTVIGVMAPEIDFPRGVGIWVPIGIRPDTQKRGSVYLQAIARVRRGYSQTQAAVQVNSLFQRLARAYPQFYTPAQQAAITALPAYWSGPARLQLPISLAAAFLLLATACLTASNLFLSRTMARRQEIATRAALGATTSRILAQFLIEGLAAASIAGLAGLGLAWCLIRFLVIWAPADLPRIGDAHIDRAVFLFCGALSSIAALACSLAPILIAVRGRLTATRTGRRLQGAFTLSQTAITVVLLTAALLIVVRVRAMLTADIGFANRDAVTMNLALKGPQPDPDLFYTRLLDGLRKSPSVTDAAAVLLRPLEGEIGWDVPFRTEFDGAEDARKLPVSNFEVVTPGYFQTVGTPLLSGRDFTLHDAENGDRVAIVSHSLADRFQRMGHPAMGSRIRLGRGSGGDWWKIVGIAADTRYRGVAQPREDIYVSYLQTAIPVNYVVVRGHGTSGDLAALVRREAARIDPGQAVARVATIAQLLDRDTAGRRFHMMLLVTFGAGALLLAAAGTCSVVAESVSVRRREIAMRTVLGAERAALIRMLMRSTLRFVLAGELTGLVAILLSGQTASQLIPGAVLIFLLAVSTAAAWVPAWTATGRDPCIVLHAD